MLNLRQAAVRILGSALLAIAVCWACEAAETASGLVAGFQAPPASARPWVYWFWLDGNLTREGITADLEAMRRAGIGGVLIMEVNQGVPRGPVRFGSPPWREMFKHVVAEAGRLGLEVDMSNDAGWCGSGGPWIKAKHAMQKVVWTETAVEGPRRFQGRLPQPKTVARYYRDIAVLAFPTPPNDVDPKKQFRIANIEGKSGALAPVYGPSGTFSRVEIPAPAKYAAVPADGAINRSRIVDLTAQLDKSGHLSWEVPAGKWTVLRLGHTPTGQGNHPAPMEGGGLECDKLSCEAMDVHFNGLMARLIADVGPAAGKTLRYTHIDSWEIYSQNWTQRFRAEFRKRRGYDPLLLLPAMTGRVIDSLEITERFLWDLRKTIAELHNENYAGRLQELAHQHGLQLTIEAYGNGLFDNLSYAGRADSPMCEFWVGGGCVETIKAMASAAHTYGKNIVGAESFTANTDAAKWTNHPFSLKALGDAAFCDGVNRFVFHRYAHQPWLDRKPGMTMGPWGIHYERTETWWEQTRPWHEYLARCNYLLRQGLFVADICYLQTEGAPNDLAHFARTAYDFDGCTPEVVLTRMKVQDGRLVLPDGVSYRLLVLPQAETMTPAMLRKIKELVSAGATVVGPRPLKSPSLSGYPDCDAQVRQLATELWGDCDGKRTTERRNGKGRVVWGTTPEAVLAGMGVPPDFDSLPPLNMPKLRYIHRAAGGTDVYFVANGSPQAMDAQCTFRVKGKRPEFWWPDTGRIERVAVYDDVVSGMRIPICLDPAGSVFVVFRPEVAPAFDRALALSRDGKPVTATSKPKPEIVVKKAMYGPWGEATCVRDVTAEVQRRVNKGAYAFKVATLAPPGRSSKPDVLRVLTVEYTVDGQPCKSLATDPELIVLFDSREPPDAKVQYGDNGQLLVEARKAGRYEVQMASGKTGRVEVPNLPQPMDVIGPWELRFPGGWGAPEHVTFDKLISWSERAEAGVKYFSGTATYDKTFRMPAAMLGKGRRVYLDLGRVQVIAQVTLNGKNLGILWKPPFRADVTDAIRVGDNRLEIGVVNLWPNRLIGDEQLPEDSKRRPEGNLVEWPKWVLEGQPSPTGRCAFTTWRLWKRDSPLLESGLLGPVRLIPCQSVVLTK